MLPRSGFSHSWKKLDKHKRRITQQAIRHKQWRQKKYFNRGGRGYDMLKGCVEQDMQDPDLSEMFRQVRVEVIPGPVDPPVVPSPPVGPLPVESKEPSLASQENQNTEFEYGVTLEPPFRLLTHQINCIGWQLQREDTEFLGIKGGIVSLDMGAGKTLILGVTILSRYKPGQCATLVVMPKSLLGNFVGECTKFFGRRFKALMWHPEFFEKEEDFLKFNAQTPYKNHAICVSYSTVLSLAKSINVLPKGGKGNKKYGSVARIFFDTPWFRLACDESHKLTSHKTLIWKAMQHIKKEYAMFLTGTPVKGYEDDLFSQFMCMGMKGMGMEDPKQWTIQNYEAANMRQLVYRKSLQECGVQLPPKNEAVIEVELSAQEKALYNIVLQKGRNVLDDFKNKTNSSFAVVLEAFTRLRQLCIAPYLLTPQSKARMTSKDKERLESGQILGGQLPEIEERIRSPEGWTGYNSSKLLKLQEIVNRFPGEKIIIFSEWSTAAQLVADMLNQKYGAGCAVMVDQGTKDRSQAVNEFKKNPQLRFLVATAVLAQGFTLIESRCAIILSSSWTDTFPRQASARIYRVGQTKEVFIYKMVVNRSIEVKMEEICSAKADVHNALIETGANLEVVERFLGGPMEEM